MTSANSKSRAGYENLDGGMTFFQKHRKVILWSVPICFLIVIGAVLLFAVFKPHSPKETYEINVDPEGYTLEHVVILSRHGLRAPTKISNWSDIASYPMGLGYLTAKGKRQTLQVGHRWRMFYRNFLSNSPREVWARSSTYPRCFETASLLLDTLYPPVNPWNFGYIVQPIPIVMVPDDNDKNIATCGTHPKPDFDYMYNETNKYLKADNFTDVGHFLSWLTEVSGYPKDKSDFVDPIVDALNCQKFNDIPIPSWAEEKAQSMDWALRKLSYEYWKESVPFYGQQIAKEIAQKLEAAADDKNHSMKLSLFVYHDTNIQSVLSALKLDYVELYPSFSGALHFQLYRKDNGTERFVRTIYYEGYRVNGEYAKHEELDIPGCPFADCPLEKFSSIFKSMYPGLNRTGCSQIDTDALL